MSIRFAVALPLTALCALAVAACGGGSGRGLPEPAIPAPEPTGAVTSINQGVIPSGSLTLQDLLRGKASGLEFITAADGTQKLQIRGMSSINPGQNPEPLILVDNMPVPMSQLSSTLAGFTREDIKRVDVLKDVASTSSYGMRAAGGVILIFTGRR